MKTSQNKRMPVHVTLKRKHPEYKENYPRISKTMSPFKEWVLKARRKSFDFRRVELDEQSSNLNTSVKWYIR